MLGEQYFFTPKQKRVLYVVAGLLWLIGIAILRFFDGLSVLSFVGISFVFTGSSSSNLKIKWWVNIGVLIVGLFLIGMSYLEHVDPIGVADVEELWIVGVIAILVGTYWLVQAGANACTSVLCNSGEITG